jgi:N-methylhydantoinase B
VVPPWGLEQGFEGSPNYIEVVRDDGTQERYAMASSIALNAGDLVRVRTGAGGGFGPPADRDPQAVLDDLRNGYVDAHSARTVYGLTL